MGLKLSNSGLIELKKTAFGNQRKKVGTPPERTPFSAEKDARSDFRRNAVIGSSSFCRSCCETARRSDLAHSGTQTAGPQSQKPAHLPCQPVPPWSHSLLPAGRRPSERH